MDDAFIAKWKRMRERYRANPEEHGVKHARLIKLWERFEGRCHLCGGRVPHPILELDAVDDDNAPTADHAKPRSQGGKAGTNLRLAHRWCNGRRGNSPLQPSLHDTIAAEVAGRFGEMPVAT